MIASWHRNRLTSTLGIEYPIIQGPLGGLSSQTGSEILPYPLQRGLVRHLSVAAAAAGRSDLLPLWAGQSAGLSGCADVSVFLQSLLEEVSAIAGPISDWSAKYREHHPTA